MKYLTTLMAIILIVLLPASVRAEGSTVSVNNRVNHELLRKLDIRKKTAYENKQREEAERAARIIEKARQEEESRIRQAEALRIAEEAKAVSYTYIEPEPVRTAVNASQGACMDWVVAAGINDITNAMTLIGLESGCNPYAVNPSSGACGIPQNIKGCGEFGYDPIAQIKWMNNYVMGYGGWRQALDFWYCKGDCYSGRIKDVVHNKWSNWY